MFFFFQAEDGIRDLYVTGVQTCALPISGENRMAERLAYFIAKWRWCLLAVWLAALGAASVAALSLPDQLSGGGWSVPRSESQAAATALQSGFTSRGASNLVLVVRDSRYTSASAEFGRR